MNRRIVASVDALSSEVSPGTPDVKFQNLCGMAVNRSLTSSQSAAVFDVAWVDKGVCLWPETVKELRRISKILIYYTPDTAFYANRSRFFAATAQLYDLVVTTKTSELEHYRRILAPGRLLLVTQSYDPRLHFPRCSFEEKREEVAIIGLCESYREKCVEQLLSEGIAVRIGGVGWERLVDRHAGNSLLKFEGAGVFGERYADVVSRAAIGLGFMTKKFPEFHTTRTLEIPACGTALATEKTTDTRKFFGENEAIFYSDGSQLVTLIKKLMKDRQKLKSITLAGTQRIANGRFSHGEMIRTVLTTVGLTIPGAESGFPTNPGEFTGENMVGVEQAAKPKVAGNRLPPVESELASSGGVTAVGDSGGRFPQSPDVARDRKFGIGFLGADWWGSDARAMAQEFRRAGHMLVERQHEDYLPVKWKSKTLRVIRRLLFAKISAEFNTAIRELLTMTALDFLVVFKGSLVKQTTLQRFRDAGTPCYCFYPDVSFRDHGSNIWNCLPFYDCVFTTKSFHLEDAAVVSRARNIELVRHGFDPEVHRKTLLAAELGEYYGADVSFVGVWSPKKERILASLIKAMPDLNLKIWGQSWDKSERSVCNKWQRRGAFGDELAAICSASRINLGLLSEAGTGVTAGDRTTARTWQIPACGGFMLHEDTYEVRQYFDAGNEIAVFSDDKSLVDAVRFYLDNPTRTEAIKAAGHLRCLSQAYTYRSACGAIIDFHKKSLDR